MKNLFKYGLWSIACIVLGYKLSGAFHSLVFALLDVNLARIINTEMLGFFGVNLRLGLVLGVIPFCLFLIERAQGGLSLKQRMGAITFMAITGILTCFLEVLWLRYILKTSTIQDPEVSSLIRFSQLLHFEYLLGGILVGGVLALVYFKKTLRMRKSKNLEDLNDFETNFD